MNNNNNAIRIARALARGRPKGNGFDQWELCSYTIRFREWADRCRAKAVEISRNDPTFDASAFYATCNGRDGVRHSKPKFDYSWMDKMVWGDEPFAVVPRIDSSVQKRKRGNRRKHKVSP